jgi:hypothetical protein
MLQYHLFKVENIAKQQKMPRTLVIFAIRVTSRFSTRMSQWRTCKEVSYIQLFTIHDVKLLHIFGEIRIDRDTSIWKIQRELPSLTLKEDYQHWHRPFKINFIFSSIFRKSWAYLLGCWSATRICCPWYCVTRDLCCSHITEIFVQCSHFQRSQHTEIGFESIAFPVRKFRRF